MVVGQGACSPQWEKVVLSLEGCVIVQSLCLPPLGSVAWPKVQYTVGESIPLPGVLRGKDKARVLTAPATPRSQQQGWQCSLQEKAVLPEVCQHKDSRDHISGCTKRRFPSARVYRVGL